METGNKAVVIKIFDPLRCGIPPIDFNNPLLRRCVDIITEARLIWGYNSIPAGSIEFIDGKMITKKKAFFLNDAVRVAMEIDDWYRKKSLLFLQDGNQVDYALLRASIKDCRKNIETKKHTTDQEILAIFAICEAFEAMPKRSGEAVRKKVLAASTFLNLTKTGLETEKQTAKKPQKIISFPIPSGANVDDIKMIFLSDERVRITIKGNSKPFHYSEMGFCKQNGLPVAMWDTLLEYAEYSGALKGVDKRKQKHSERLNKALKGFFETNEDLIVNHQTVFGICKKAGKNKKPVNIQSKECPKCKDTHKHFCFTCNDETEECKECHDEMYEEAHKKLNR